MTAPGFRESTADPGPLRAARALRRGAQSVSTVMAELIRNGILHRFGQQSMVISDMGRLRRELTCEGQSRDLRVSVQHRDIFEAVNRVNSF